MFRGFEFNKECRVIKTGLYQQECGVLHDFLASDHTNVRFEYDTVAEAKNASQAIRRYIRENKQNLTAKQRNSYVFVVRKEDNKG